MSHVSEFLSWLDAKCEEVEKAEETRRLIHREQRVMRKTHNEVVTTKAKQLRGEILTSDQWRALLTSGKSRRQISDETGCIDRTIRNRAQALHLPVPAKLSVCPVSP